DLKTSVSEQTDVSGHITKVVDGLVGVVVQVIQRLSNVSETCSMTSGVSKDRLNRSHFELVLTEAVHDWCNRKSVYHSGTRINGLVDDVRQSSNTDDAHC